MVSCGWCILPRRVLILVPCLQLLKTPPGSNVIHGSKYVMLTSKRGVNKSNKWIHSFLSSSVDFFVDAMMVIYMIIVLLISWSLYINKLMILLLCLFCEYHCWWYVCGLKKNLCLYCGFCHWYGTSWVQDILGCLVIFMSYLIPVNWGLFILVGSPIPSLCSNIGLYPNYVGTLYRSYTFYLM